MSAGEQGNARQLALPLGPTSEIPELRQETPWEQMLADYRSFGLSVGTHPLELLRPYLPGEALSSRDVHQAPHGEQVAAAGLVIARQRPETANGVVFMLLEDEHGQMNLIVPPDVYERFRAQVRSEPLLVVRGRYERVGENRNIVAQDFASLAPLARQVANDIDVRSALPQPHSFGRR